MSRRVKFSQGTFSDFENIQKDPDTIYFLTDTREIYLGSNKYSGTDLPTPPSASGNYFLTASPSGSDIVYTWQSIPSANGNSF